MRGRFAGRCGYCGQIFRDRRRAGYCSVDCQRAARTHDYPPVEQMVTLACRTSLKHVARGLGIPYITLCAYVRVHATPEQLARLSAADVARKRGRTSAAWPPLEDLERLFHEHGSRWIAERLGVQRGTVTRRIKHERARRGLPTTRLKRFSSALTKPLGRT